MNTLTVTREHQNEFIRRAIGDNETLQCFCTIAGVPEVHNESSQKVGSWCWNYEKFRRFYETGTPEFSIFMKGNSKLPFWAFSALPAITCPGAGECLEFCYSFKAWRYPAALLRQLQNTLLIWSDSGREKIRLDANRKIKTGQTVRLYVDGDLDSHKTMQFWFEWLRLERPDIDAYGYSKSWALFLTYPGEFPSNYKLNLSSGSVYGKAVRKRMQELPVTRGEFIAVSDCGEMPERKGKNKAGLTWAEWSQVVRANARSQSLLADDQKKAFVCAGKCWDCLPNGEHACGSDRMNGIPVLIGIH